jgi:hypothetical protein
MDIVIDLNPIFQFFAQPAHIILTRMIFLFGWLPISLTLLYGFKEMWLFYIRKKWTSTIRYVLLAIDIPRGNEQSPKAVENMFSYLAGAHSTFNLIETYWEGKVQLAFSLEIVSIDGYTQFLIRTPVHSRDLVESAVYSQYPDAEITEVNDYTEGIPIIYPNDEYDVWGCEFIQRTSSAYPIKTYKEFEHPTGDPELAYKDPMATLMDLTSSLKKGEQLWYQIILIPIGFDWPEIADPEVKKILKEKDTSKKNLGDKIVDTLVKWLEEFSEAIYTMWGDIEEKEKEKKEEPFKMMNLKPREKKQVEALHDKTSKLGFEFKIRFVYVAKKEVMNKPKVSNGFVGYMKQFATNDLNNLKPDMDITATKVHYFFKDYRLTIKKRKIVRNYKKRDKTAGRKAGIMNIEELATIWHFPVESAVKAPLIQKAARRKAEPPMGLPITSEGKESKEESFREEIYEGGPGLEEEKFVRMPILPTESKVVKNNLTNKSGEEIFFSSAGKNGLPPDNLPVA